tara:strand:+ start:1621 stop:1821 length:201 start_codon:yes stop_codon:yes gene_type:complete
MEEEIINLGYINEACLKRLGVKYRTNVLIAKTCIIVSIENISIKSNVRIDGYTTLLTTGKQALSIG